MNDNHPISTSFRRGRISVRKADRIVIITVTGDLDGALTTELEHKVRVAARLRPAALVLDLAAVDFAALRGLRTVRRLRRDLRRANVALTVVTGPAFSHVEQLADSCVAA